MPVISPLGNLLGSSPTQRKILRLLYIESASVERIDFDDVFTLIVSDIHIKGGDQFKEIAVRDSSFCDVQRQVLISSVRVKQSIFIPDHSLGVIKPNVRYHFLVQLLKDYYKSEEKGWFYFCHANGDYISDGLVLKEHDPFENTIIMEGHSYWWPPLVNESTINSILQLLENEGKGTTEERP